VPKVIIVYESKYGNTRRVAETILEGMREVDGVEATLSELREVAPDKLVEYDAIVVGSPNHLSMATRSIRKFKVQGVRGEVGNQNKGPSLVFRFYRRLTCRLVPGGTTVTGKILIRTQRRRYARPVPAAAVPGHTIMSSSKTGAAGNASTSS